MEPIELEGSNPFVIPRWFALVVSGTCSVFVLLFIPWASWVTINLMSVSHQMERAQRNEQAIQRLETKFENHEDLGGHREMKLRMDRAEAALKSLSP